MEYGAKAKNLLMAKENGIKVPCFFSFDLKEYISNKEQIEKRIEEMLSEFRLLAIRSSTEIEDGNYCSAAGIFESVVGVNCMNDVYEAIHKCQESFNSRVGKTYAEYYEKTIGNGLIIQECIKAKKSGVIISDRPKAGELLVEICWGFAEKLVSGEINPELWKCNRYSDNKNKLMRGKQFVKRTWDDETNSLQDKKMCETDEIADEALLNDIVSLERNVYNCFGPMNEIEWVQDYDGEVWLIQVRPLVSESSYLTEA